MITNNIKEKLIIELAQANSIWVTAVLFYIPLFIMGTIQLVGTGIIPWYRGMLSIGLGIGFNIFSIVRQGK